VAAPYLDGRGRKIGEVLVLSKVVAVAEGARRRGLSVRGRKLIERA
jgi:hypothetical protein